MTRTRTRTRTTLTRRARFDAQTSSIRESHQRRQRQRLQLNMYRVSLAPRNDAPTHHRFRNTQPVHTKNTLTLYGQTVGYATSQRASTHVAPYHHARHRASHRGNARNVVRGDVKRLEGLRPRPGHPRCEHATTKDSNRLPVQRQ
jgi:hypothetical protein